MLEDLRVFTTENPISLCFEDRRSPLIKISGGTVTYYKSKTEKIGAFLKRTKKDKFVLAWMGQWSTDVFTVSEADIKMVLEEYGYKY